MTDRRPIAEFFAMEDPRADVIVGDNDGHQAEAAVDPDDGGLVDLTDPTNPVELDFEPTWFTIIPDRM